MARGLSEEIFVRSLWEPCTVAGVIAFFGVTEGSDGALTVGLAGT
jgi:hypothetical protein